MLFLLPLIGAAILGVAAAASVVRVDIAHRAVLVRFGKRVEGKDGEYGEGWHGFWDGVMPFIDRLEAEPVTLDSAALATEIVTKDNLKIKVGGSVQFRIDDVYHFKGINPQAMGVGMSDAIKSELGIIAGRADGDKFVHSRREIWLLINSVLRFSVAPHYRASAADSTVFDPADGDAEVEPQERLSFYEKNAHAIGEALKQETGNPDDHSGIEERYGIDVVVFELASVEFSQETMAALEKKQQAAHTADAAKEAYRRQREIFDDLKGQVGPERALNEVSLIVGGKDRGSRQVISVEGLEGVSAVLGDALRRFLGGGNGS